MVERRRGVERDDQHEQTRADPVRDARRVGPEVGKRPAAEDEGTGAGERDEADAARGHAERHDVEQDVGRARREVLPPRHALAAFAPLAVGRRAGAADPQAGGREVMILTIEEHARLAGGALGRPSIDPRVLEAMRRVPRHAFVPTELDANAYEDRPLPIGHGQTISQPFIVALMTDMLRTAPEQAVIEVGTGSG